MAYFFRTVFPLYQLFGMPFCSSIVSAQSNGGASDSNGGKHGDGSQSGERRGGLARTTSHMPDKSEMKKVFEKFDENKDGVIASDELGNFMKRLGFELCEEELVSLIKTVDDNSDGTVDFDEFYSLYQSLTGCGGNGTTGDADEDSAAMERDQEDNLKEAFSVFDKDGSGAISVDELSSVLTSLGMTEGKSLKQCRQMIQRVDADGDGQVNFEEFKKMMNSDVFHS